MKTQRLVLIILLISSLMFFSTANTVAAEIEVNQTTELTIYTYESLLADPGYAFDRAFESYAGLPNNSVEVVLLNDAGSVVTRAASEKGDPVADVLIGIDNGLVHQARDLDILQPYQPAGVENLVDGLVDGLADDYLLTPYDYGVISLWYLQNQQTAGIDPSNFDLQDLLDENLDEQLIVQNPLVSSPGLGFLLSTIAMYGPDAATPGLVSGDWEEFWRQLSLDTAITNSWGDAITQLYTPEANRSMMVSYSTSPAYGACLFEDYSTTALLPSVDGQLYGWQQIEGLGLVKGSDNQDLAKQFIDWFITEEVQSQIHLNQWVYPALEGIDAPSCYDAAIPASDIAPLNDYLTTEQIDNNLDLWLDTWEIAWAEGPNRDASLPFTPYIFGLTLLLIPILIRRRH